MHMNNTLTTDITTLPITHHNLNDLAELVAQRQTDPNFMRFLKEQPMTPLQNREILKKKFDSPHTKCIGIQIEGIQDIV